MIKSELRTPCYIIDRDKFIENVHEVMDSFKAQWGSNMDFGYSIKTNNNSGFIKIAKECGWFAEAVSCDEYMHARNLGFESNRIIFNGPLKGKLLLQACREGSIVNVDHMDEVHTICEFLNEIEKANVKLGIRINFDLEKRCPGETSVGEDVSRFGICYENGDVREAITRLQSCGVTISGLHMHTSTKSRSAKVFAELSRMVCKVTEEFNLKLEYVDMGGGYFGGQVIEGKPTMLEYANTICAILRQTFHPEETRLILEPGASVIATSVEYMSKVDSVRDIRGVRVVTLDGTALHINPFMFKRIPQYELQQLGDKRILEQQVCGCTCMENDRFFEIDNEKELLVGSYVIFKNAGAYSMGFNSHFIVNPPIVYLFENNDYNIMN